MNTKSAIEFFHLNFLDQLSRNLDNTLYAIKGGCNLRFFYHSIRYSEDLDLDVQIINKETLKSKVDKIIEGIPLRQILKTKGISILSVSAPKQTHTTQRWKISLQTSAPLPLNTKIEFSRRSALENILYEPINSTVLQAHNLTPIFCSHHNKDVAFEQKIEALSGRAQTQSRDIFDLFLLINAGAGLIKKDFDNTIIAKAIDNALSISFEEFCSQVVSFLALEYQEQYNSKELWEQMVVRVVEHLEALKS